MLRNPITTPSSEPPPAAAARSSLRSLAAAIAVTAAVAGVAGWQLHRAPAAAPGPLVRFTIPLGADQVISEVVRRRHLVAVSPDGTRLAHIANDQIYSRSIDGLETARSVDRASSQSKSSFHRTDSGLPTWRGRV